MKRVPYAVVIIENVEGEILLLLRENKSGIPCPNHWTLIGGKAGEGEPPETAARRAVEEETGLQIDVSFWKRYDRQHPLFIVDQYIFTGCVGKARDLLVLGRDAQFFKPDEIRHLNVGYGFDALLDEYFLIHER
jgi:8-oxo-dGTP pyrophosphatase MutT (NUDIX family)